jgi:hypothetical protein
MKLLFYQGLDLVLHCLTTLIIYCSFTYDNNFLVRM